MDARRTAQSPLPVQLADFEEPRMPILPVVAALLVVLVAAAIGWALGGQLTKEPPVPAVPSERLAALGPLHFDLDGAWTPVAAKGELADMRVRELRVFAPVAGLPGRTWIARAPATDRTLVPTSIRDRLAKPLGPPQKTIVAGHTAWSYGTLALRSGEQLELTVLPTSAGMVLFGCEASKAWWSTVTGCARSVRAVGGASTVLPSAALPFQHRIGKVVTVLNRKRRYAGRALLHAHTPAGQSAAALRIAAAHRAAAAALAPLAPKSGAPAALLRRLRASAAAYGALGHAAARHDRPRYAAARHRAHRADAALRKALHRATA
jgi:hypothetical protein